MSEWLGQYLLLLVDLSSSTTCVSHCCPTTQKEEVDRLFLALDLATHVVNHAQEADVRLDKDELPLRVQLLIFGSDARTSLL